jgi:hypothetical protein
MLAKKWAQSEILCKGLIIQDAARLHTLGQTGNHTVNNVHIEVLALLRIQPRRRRLVVLKHRIRGMALARRVLIKYLQLSISCSKYYLP